MSSHPFGGCFVSAFKGDDDRVVLSFFGLDRPFESLSADNDASGVTGVEAKGFIGVDLALIGLLFRFGLGEVPSGDKGEEVVDNTGSDS
jgi:hypothetical protein